LRALSQNTTVFVPAALLLIGQLRDRIGSDEIGAFDHRHLDDPADMPIAASHDTSPPMAAIALSSLSGKTQTLRAHRA
jgi:hypothetical protein